jgi:hypothetical protein
MTHSRFIVMNEHLVFPSDHYVALFLNREGSEDRITEAATKSGKLFNQTFRHLCGSDQISPLDNGIWKLNPRRVS